MIKTSTYTHKKFVLHLIYMYVVSIYSKSTAEKKVSRVMGGDSSTSDYPTYFLESILCFLQCPLFLDGQVHSLKYAQRTLYKILRLFSSTLITLVFNVTCHCSVITQDVNNYNGSQCHVSSYKGPSSSIMAFLLALMMARTLSLMYCK